MAINLQSLDKFRVATEWTAKGIANLDGTDAIRQNGTYSGALSALGRSKIERAANNDVRTELLKALGNAFGLAGMGEKDGTVTFSKGFMDKLERILGSDFKRDDFKIDADGKVSSGRPLTSRRITAILAKAEVAANKVGETGNSDSDEIGETGEVGKAATLTKTGGVRKDATYGPYAKKLATIKQDISKLDKEAYSQVHKFFKRVEMTLDFLYNELDIDRSDPNASDPSALRNDEEYEFLKEIGDLKGAKPAFQYYDSKSGRFVKLDNTYTYQNDVLWHRIGGGLLHLERAAFRQNESEDIAPLRKYIVDNLRLFVMKSIDTYFAAKDAGKMDAFFAHLRSPGACIEDQCLHFVTFETKHLSEGWQGVSKAEAEELEKIANRDPGEDGPAVDNAEALFVDVFGDLDGEEWFNDLEKKSWTPDVAKFLKDNLVGKTCVMMSYNETTQRFDEMKNDQGAPVIRPLTDADIETLCRKAFEKVYS